MRIWSMVVGVMLMTYGVTSEVRAIPWTQTDAVDPAREIVFDGRGASSSFPDHIRDDSVALFEDIMMNPPLEFMLPEVANERGTFTIQETQPNLVPEPATVLLLGMGLLGFAGFSRKKAIK